MLFDTWTPGFITANVKAGQVLVGLAAGLAIGNSAGGSLSAALKVCLWFMPVGVGAAALVSGEDAATVLFVVTVIIGGTVSAAMARPVFVLAVAGLAGLALGFGSQPQGGSTGSNAIVIFAHLLATAFLIAGVAGATRWTLAFSPALWPRIGIRILGSWLVAIALIMVAFSVSG